MYEQKLLLMLHERTRSKWFELYTCTRLLLLLSTQGVFPQLKHEKLLHGSCCVGLGTSRTDTRKGLAMKLSVKISWHSHKHGRSVAARYVTTGAW